MRIINGDNAFLVAHVDTLFGNQKHFAFAARLQVFADASAGVAIYKFS